MTVLLFALAILIGFITGYIVGIDTTLTDAMIDKKEVLEIIESFKVFSNQKLSTTVSEDSRPLSDSVGWGEIAQKGGE